MEFVVIYGVGCFTTGYLVRKYGAKIIWKKIQELIWFSKEYYDNRKRV
jgi:hypothetical protein